MQNYEKMYEEAKKGKNVKVLTPQMFKFTDKEPILIGSYVSKTLIGVTETSKGYYQYVFHTDTGLVKIGPGSGFDADVSGQLGQGGIYRIEFLGKVDISGGRTVNKYNVEEIGFDHAEEVPHNDPPEGKKGL